MSRGLEHICLEAGCRVVVLNPVGLSTRIHNSHTPPPPPPTPPSPRITFLSLPLPSAHSSSSNCRSSSILRETEGSLLPPSLPPSTPPFIVILGPARIRLDAPLKDALAPHKGLPNILRLLMPPSPPHRPRLYLFATLFSGSSRRSGAWKYRGE